MMQDLWMLVRGLLKSGRSLELQPRVKLSRSKKGNLRKEKTHGEGKHYFVRVLKIHTFDVLLCLFVFLMYFMAL